MGFCAYSDEADYNSDINYTLLDPLDGVIYLLIEMNIVVAFEERLRNLKH